MDKKLPAGEFKQTCLRVLEDVAKTGRPVIITKRGKPVAKLVPVETAAEREAEVLAGLRGKARMLVSEDELMRPVLDAEAWATE